MAYKMTHPDADGVEVNANRDDVPMYESQGWSTKAKSPTTSDEPSDS